MIQIFFTALVLLVAAGWVLLQTEAVPARRFALAAGMLVWLAFTGGVASSGVLHRFEKLPPPLASLIAGAMLLTTALAFSRYGSGIVSSASIPLIVGLQAFRIGVEVFLWWGGRTGLVPPQMTLEGRNLDLLTGLTALPVAWLFARGSLGRMGVLIWNLAGLALLVNVMTVAFLSFPTPLQHFSPATDFVASFPYVWLPTVLVQAAWFLHLILFRQLAVQA